MRQKNREKKRHAESAKAEWIKLKWEKAAMKKTGQGGCAVYKAPADTAKRKATERIVKCKLLQKKRR